jgi:hypothetical protein
MNTITVIELPRSQWRLKPPRRAVVLATLAGVVVSALAFGLLGV